MTKPITKVHPPDRATCAPHCKPTAAATLAAHKDAARAAAAAIIALAKGSSGSAGQPPTAPPITGDALVGLSADTLRAIASLKALKDGMPAHTTIRTKRRNWVGR